MKLGGFRFRNELKKEVTGNITAFGSRSMNQSLDRCVKVYQIKMERRSSATQKTSLDLLCKLLIVYTHVWCRLLCGAFTSSHL